MQGLLQGGRTIVAGVVAEGSDYCCRGCCRGVELLVQGLVQGGRNIGAGTSAGIGAGGERENADLDKMCRVSDKKGCVSDKSTNLAPIPAAIIRPPCSNPCTNN